MYSVASSSTRILDDDAQKITRGGWSPKEIKTKMLNNFVVRSTSISVYNDDVRADYSILLCNGKSLQRESADRTTRFIGTTLTEKSNIMKATASIAAVSFTVLLKKALATKYEL